MIVSYRELFSSCDCIDCQARQVVNLPALNVGCPNCIDLVQGGGDGMIVTECH